MIDRRRRADPARLLVSLTLGNAPVADLLMVRRDRTQFQVDVKGLASKNFWLIQRREPRDDLYNVLVYLPSGGSAPDFFVLSCAELMSCREEYRQHIEVKKGKYRDEIGGINWSTALEHEGHWGILRGSKGTADGG